MSERIQLIQEDPGDVEQLFHLARRGVEVSYHGLQGSQLAAIAMGELVEADVHTYQQPAIDFVEDLIAQTDGCQGFLSDPPSGIEATHVALTLFRRQRGGESLERLDAAYETLSPETDGDEESPILHRINGSLRRILRHIGLRQASELAQAAEARMASSVLGAIKTLAHENVGNFSADVVPAAEHVNDIAFELGLSEPELLMKRYYDFFPEITDAFDNIIGDEQRQQLDELHVRKLHMLARNTDVGLPVHRGLALQALADLRDRFPEDKAIQRRARREARDIAVDSVFQRGRRIEHPVEIQGKQRILEGTIFDMGLLTHMISLPGQYTRAADTEFTA